ncbi:MAG: hypothetical protein AMXMBFR58_00230 [Phycisphaerae bacterium]
MAKRPIQPVPQPIGEVMRHKRIEVLGKGLREMAAILGIAPAHMTDIEKGRRTPSEPLLARISEAYKIDIAELRVGWLKMHEDVKLSVTKNVTANAKAPEFLRAASELSAEEWDSLIARAKQLAKDGGRKQR